VGQFDQGGRRYPSEAVMVKPVSEHLAEGGFAGLDTGATCLAPKRSLHASWVVGSEGLLVDRLPNSNWLKAVSVLHLFEKVRATGAFF
jgi:hypothetical protein